MYASITTRTLSVAIYPIPDNRIFCFQPFQVSFSAVIIVDVLPGVIAYR